MDIFFQILDGNWLDDAYGRLVYRSSQKCIAIGYLFRVNCDLSVYRYIVAPLGFTVCSMCNSGPKTHFVLHIFARSQIS